MCAGIALALCAQSAPVSSAADKDRLATYQSLVMLAGRVLDTEQLVIATHGVCVEHLPPIDALAPAYSRWLRDNGVKFERAHRILNAAFAQRVLGDRLATDPVAASIIHSLPQMQINDYERGLTSARKADCYAFTKQLGSGTFDYARQSPQAFRIIERVDLGKPETYTMTSLMALGK